VLDKNQKKLVYPEIQLTKMLFLAKIIHELIITENPDIILIEEIAGSKQRLGQKVLDGLHWILLLVIGDYIRKVRYMDVTGCRGWRYLLGLKLSEADKSNNKENKKLNKKLKRGTKKLPIVTAKHLAQRIVNKVYKTTFDVNVDTQHADICDSIAMAYSFLTHILK
jgi:hypothetical protein